jgi:tetratricopeptide (TPR) repeat protein
MRRVSWSGVGVIVLLTGATTALQPAPRETSRQAVAELVTQIQRADYEGNRATLLLLYAKLEPFVSNPKLASRVRYWRGFAVWRRAINGFNESADPKDLQHDLQEAVLEFKESAAKDPDSVEAKIGAISCFSNLTHLARGDLARMQELIAQSSSLVREVRASDPENPRFRWVMGPILWNIPVERGGGQDKAIENYQKGLEIARKAKAASGETLEPRWGEPELLMSLAWSNLNRTTPDLKAAEESARAALALVPYWHYVRDILLPQIRGAQAAAT